MCLKGKKKLLNDNKRKHLKHRELGLYDKWLLNNNYVPKFNDTKCTDNIIDTEEAIFDKKKLEEYIISTNKDLDKVNIFSKIKLYNYKITNKKELDKIFDNCIQYILNYLNETNII